jgi:hypothetical protein
MGVRTEKRRVEPGANIEVPGHEKNQKARLLRRTIRS